MEGIKNFLLCKGGIEVSELRDFFWVDIRELEIPGVWCACTE
jgi:hypothetical protein